MKKILSAVLLSATLYAGGTITNIHEPEPLAPIGFEPYAYAGVSGVYGEFDAISGGYDDFKDDNIGGQLNVGYMLFGQYEWSFGVEGRYGYISGDLLDVSWLTGYGKVQYEVNKFGIYGLLGYGITDFSTTFDYSDFRVNIDDSTSDFTWGAGVAYDYTKKLSVFIDYTVLPDYEVGTDGVDSDIVSVGVNYKF